MKHESLVHIVDDNNENLKVLGGIMKEAGYSIAVSTNGADALVFASSNLPDIILLDIMMPGMDGYEVCTRLKNEKRTKNIPVIFLSARRETGDIWEEIRDYM